MLSTTLRSLATPTRRIRALRRRNQKAFRPSLAMMEDRLLLSSFPNGSVNVAIIGGVSSNSFGGTMPIGIPPLSNFNFTPLNNTAVNRLSDLAAYDTVILNVSGTLGMNRDVNNLSAG